MQLPRTKPRQTSPHMGVLLEPSNLFIPLTVDSYMLSDPTWFTDDQKLLQNTYRTARMQIGSQRTVADAIGRSQTTIYQRENGLTPITKEMLWSLLAIRVRTELGYDGLKIEDKRGRKILAK